MTDVNLLHPDSQRVFALMNYYFVLVQCALRETSFIISWCVFHGKSLSPNWANRFVRRFLSCNMCTETFCKSKDPASCRLIFTIQDKRYTTINGFGRGLFI